MNLASTEFSHLEDRESEFFNTEEFPSDEPWEEPASLFESLDALMMRKSLPSCEELRALDTRETPLAAEMELEDWDDFAAGEY